MFWVRGQVLGFRDIGVRVQGFGVKWTAIDRRLGLICVARRKRM